MSKIVCPKKMLKGEDERNSLPLKKTNCGRIAQYVCQTGRKRLGQKTPVDGQRGGGGFVKKKKS